MTRASAARPRRVVLLGALPRGGAWRDALTGEMRCCLISVSPQLSSQLDVAGVPYRRSEAYFAAADWAAIHGAVARTLSGLATDRRGPPDRTWLDDWSHLLGDELRDTFYWTRVAEQVLRRERPSDIRVQRLTAAHPAAAALAALRSAFEHLGRRCGAWPPPGR